MKLKNIKKFIVVLIIAMSSTVVYATEENPKGIELETSIELNFESVKSDGEFANSLGQLFTIGFGKAELSLGAPYNLNGTEKGINAFEIGMKLLAFGKDADTGKIEIETVYEIPSGAVALVSIFTKAFGSLESEVVLGWNNAGFAGNENSYGYGIAFDHGVIEKLNVKLGLEGEYSSEVKPLSVSAGFVVAPIEAIKIECGVSYGITNDADDYSLSVASTFAF